MHEDATGKIGTIDVRLAPRKVDVQRYERRYVPVTPASHEIVGANAKVAPDTTVAEWHINNWSAGEGDLRWQDRDRYNESDGVGPTSDGSGLVVNAHVEQINDTGGATVMEDAKVLTRGDLGLYTADDMAGKLFVFDDSASEWDELTDIGGTGTDDIESMAAIGSYVYVAETGTTGDLRQVNTALLSNTKHYDSLGSNSVVIYGDILYSLLSGASDLWKIDQSSTDTKTAVVDVTGGDAPNGDMVKRMTTSDVGPVWISRDYEGTSYIWEYNQADDTGYIVGELPRDVYPYDIEFHMGIYFVAFRYATEHDQSGDAWLYFQVGGQNGVAGPIRSTTGTTASKPVAIAGAIGDRLYLYFDTELWAYDLSTGGISMAARALSEPTAITTYGSDIHLVTGTTAFRVNTALFDTAAGAELTTGRYDFGYLGLNKTLAKVTVTVEDPLATSETVGVEYSVDGATFVALTGTMVATETTKTWIVSNKTTTVRGIDVEFKVKLKANTTASSPKVISLTAEAVGSESRLEWILLLDVSDNNEQHGHVTVDGLKALKTSHAVVEFGDPWQVLPHVATETFDVTVEEVNLPDIMPGADPVAVVRLRAVATV